MPQVRTAILLSIVCLYLTSKVSGQQSSTPPYCIQHHEPENSCYQRSEVIGINDTYAPQTVSSFLYDKNTKIFTIVFHQQFLSDQEQRAVNVTILKLCHEEALKLTVSDLECGLSCTAERYQFIANSVSITCGKVNYTDTLFNGNRTTIAFRPNSAVQSCNNLSVNLVLIDTDDINECRNSGAHNCSENAQCFDEVCGYSCLCKSGYYMGEDNYTCLPIPVFSVEFDQSSYTFFESNESARICIDVTRELEEYAGTTAVLNITMIPNTTQEGEDYVYYGSPITINDPSKSFQVCINFTIVDDEVSEGPENISVHLDLSMMSDASGALDIQRVATIIINDNVGFAVVPMSNPEYPVLHSENVSFTCASEPGYPISSIRWRLNGHSLSNSQELEISIISRNEPSGSLSSVLTLPPILKYNNASIVCVFIFEDMPTSVSDTANLDLQYIRIAFEMTEYTISESIGTLEPHISVVSTTRKLTASYSITVIISSESGSAQGGSDFDYIEVNITLSPGSQSSPISIDIIDDSMVEPNETFTLHVTPSSPGVFIDTPSVTVTIVDDDSNTTRTCNTSGTLASTECIILDLEQRAKASLASNDSLRNETRLIIRDLVEELINVSKPSLMQPSLESIIRSLSAITETLENISSTDKRIIEIFNNLLDASQGDGWKNVLFDGHKNASEILLDNAERYAILLATSANSKPIIQSRSNIVIRSLQYREPPSTMIQFPTNADLINFTRIKHSEANINIPQSLIQERFIDGKPLPVAFILFRNLPTSDFIKTESASQVVSAQVGVTRRSFALIHDPVILNFGFEATGHNSSHSCVYWNFSQPFGNGSWISDGVTTKCVSTSNNQTSVMCASTHLTSFAVLVDVTGALGKVSSDVQFALEIVSYIGCAISIVCLLITVVFFLLQGKTLFAKVHYFVHLNLAFTLLLANIVFVSSVETATVNQIACAFVAALLHYLFLSAFCWMLCEGIVLYLLLVVVFGSNSHKLWIFMIIGYLLPLPVVIVTVGVRYQYYGVKSECGQLLYCWLSTKHGTIYGFVAPVLAIISANVVFLLIALQVLWRSKSQQLKRSKDNTNTNIKTARAVMLASVVLLPLLGLTWAFGVLNVNQHTVVFAWLFTIFNSFQGAFLFFFHVLRSEMVQKRISSRLQTLKGTLRSSNTTTTRWSNSTTRIGYNSTINQNGNGNLTKQAAENVSTCELSDHLPPAVTDKDDSTTVTVTKEDQELPYEQPKIEDVVTPTEKESNEHDYGVQCQTSTPEIERAFSDGSVVIESQVDITTHKLTVLKINQLLRRTGKLLATNQEVVEETMEINMNFKQ